MDRHLAACGCDAATELLASVYRVQVAKTIDPLDPQGFLRIVTRLQHALRGVTAAEEAAAMRTALKALDVDWKNLTLQGRENVFAAARAAIDGVPTRVLPKIEEKFQVVGPAVMGEARGSSIRRFGFNIGVAMTQRDLQAEAFIRASVGNFIRDQYGARRDELSAIAREVVAQGLEAGEGSKAIAGNLEQVLGNQVMRSKDYWQIIATSFSNQARTFSQLNAYAEAGVQRYTFDAVLDEVTTDQCRFYHGKTFSVGAGIATATRVMQARSPEEVKNINPWIRSGKDEGGNRILYYVRDGEPVVVAQVDRSGQGARDDVGEYSRAMDSQKLEQSGIPWPPLHGHCRSTIVPEV